MLDQEPSGGGAANDPSGTKVNSQKDQQSDSGEEKPRVVRFEDHKRAIDDLHKYKSEAQTLREQLEERESERLREKEDFKALAEREKKLREETEDKLRKHSSFYQNETKRNAIRAAALKAGIRSEAESDLELIPLDGIEVEITSTGRFLVHGADSFVEDLKRKRPHWFRSSQIPTVNSGGASSSLSPDAELTPKALYELERKDPAKFKEAVKKYQQQKLARRA